MTPIYDQKGAKTYNSRDSLVITHSTTSLLILNVKVLFNM